MRLLNRALFWKVYATLMGSLLIMAVMAAGTVHLFMGPSKHPVTTFQDRAISALMPIADAPHADTRAALERLAEALGSAVAIRAPDGRTEMTARPQAYGARGLHPTRSVLRARRVIPLAAGRRLIIDEPFRLGRGGPHILAMLLVLAILVGVAAAPVVAGLTRRLERLRASVDIWGSGELKTRATVEGSDEVSAVAASFNAAADRIEALLAAHQSLLAHASHELRSPLARLRVATEVFAATGRADLLPAIHAEVAELDALVEEILLASRLDHAAEAPQFARVDLLALAAEEAARSGVTLAAVGVEAPPFAMDGSPRLLRRLVRNLIENAQKHGGPPVEVALTHLASPRGPVIRLSVSDGGPGIPESERERVFAPFYRPQGRPEAAGSWGLGLSLVRQIAERHAGVVACLAGRGGGAVFTVDLPARAQAGAVELTPAGS